MCGRIARRVSAENKRVRRGRHLKYWPEAHADAAHVMSDDPAPALITALQEPAAYPHAVESVRLVETHISWVLLAGDYAYKIKKPVDFGFLDFSSLAQRRPYCEEDLRLNRRFAPQLYLTVVPRGPRPTRVTARRKTCGNRCRKTSRRSGHGCEAARRSNSSTAQSAGVKNAMRPCTNC